MTYLELVNSLKSETGVAGNTLATLTGLSREMQRLANWVSQAWREIQLSQQDWDFLRREVTFNTVDAQQQYHVGAGLDINVSDFKKWRNDSFRSYLASAGVGTEVILSQYYNYSEFRDFYLLGSRKLVTGRPLYITINPNDRSLLLGFTPNDVYTVTAEYYRATQELTADADVPLMPEDFHMAIVYKAMVKYGLFESAQEQITSGKEQYAMIINQLQADQAPIIQMGQSFI